MARVLGTFQKGALVTFRVVWTPESNSPNIVGSVLTLTSPSGAKVEPPVESEADPNTYVARALLAQAGRWRVTWSTTPAGGVQQDLLVVV